MFKKLDFILQKYEELSVTVSDPAVIADQARWQKHIKEMGEMEPIVLKYREYKKAQEEKEQTLELLDDSSLDDDMPRTSFQNSTISSKAARRSSRSSFYPRTPTTKRTSIWSFAPAPAERKLPCSRGTSCACTYATPSAAAGRQSLPI